MTPELILIYCACAVVVLLALIPILRDVNRRIDAEIAYRESL